MTLPFKHLFALLSCIPLAVYSAPMSYKGSVTTMTDLSKRYTSVEANYAYDAKNAVGVKLFHMDNNDRQRDGFEINHLHRVFRSNQKYSQMNVWLSGGLGYLEGSNERAGNDSNVSTAFISPALQWDYETKRVFLLASHQLIRGDSINHDTTKLKAGFSFYETSYDETQPWLILDVMNINGINPRPEVTPMLRLINKALYLEGGVSNMGNPRFHVMYTF